MTRRKFSQVMAAALAVVGLPFGAKGAEKKPRLDTMVEYTESDDGGWLKGEFVGVRFCIDGKEVTQAEYEAARRKWYPESFAKPGSEIPTPISARHFTLL